MAYTVKEIAKLSGVTVRTLHYYEEIGILKPAYYGANGYRYYEEKELLQLQQILFFKELGFTLKKLEKILGRSDFDQLAALYSHRHSLCREKEKIGELIKTIDKTIKHLTGKRKMKDKEIFGGFVTEVKIDPKNAAEVLVLNNLREPEAKKRDKAFYERVNKEANNIFSQVVSYIDKGLEPSSELVQKMIKKHHAFSEEFHVATKEVYEALAELYATHPDYRKQLDPFHPKLAEYIARAMKIFADSQL